MLFSSFIFLFGSLPIALVAFFVAVWFRCGATVEPPAH